MTSSPLLPLCVDLDGTLVRTDTLVESLLELIRQRPLAALLMPLWLLKGKAGFKREIAARVDLPPAALPYRDGFLSWLREQAKERPVYLTTAAHHSIAERIAQHIGCFNGVIATQSLNLSAENKAAALVQRFGERQFDYAGNAADDLPVWRRARKAVVVGAPASISQRARAVVEVVREFDPPLAGQARIWMTLWSWIRALRLYQWVKNLLVFVAPIAAHTLFEPPVLASSLEAFLAFCLAASGVYLINDLLDLASDRQHPRKRLRPFAQGTLPLTAGLLVAPALIGGSFLIGARLDSMFLLVLSIYLVLTLLYSFWLKRVMFVDTATLAGLYTLRVVAGAAAVDLGLSFWLLGVCVYGFLSLALLKRYSELVMLRAQGGGQAEGRNYRGEDEPIVRTIGVAAGLIASLVMALYIDSSASHTLYAQPDYLWALVVLMTLGVGYIWMKAGRGAVHDDPIVFLAQDRFSLLLLAAGILSVALAS